MLCTRGFSEKSSDLFHRVTLELEDQEEDHRSEVLFSKSSIIGTYCQLDSQLLTLGPWLRHCLVGSLLHTSFTEIIGNNSLEGNHYENPISQRISLNNYDLMQLKMKIISNCPYIIFVCTGMCTCICMLGISTYMNLYAWGSWGFNNDYSCHILFTLFC